MAEAPPEVAVGTAPGKLILAGEHAVVHGRPALAVPFAAVGAVAEARRVEGPLAITSDREGVAVHGLVLAAEAALAAFDMEPRGLALRVRSSIPVGAGLGSSAATAVAVVRAVAAAVGAPLSLAALRDLATVAEREAHGRPSGIDVAAVLAEGPFRFRLGEPPTPVEASFAPCWVVADSGRPRDTRAAVEAVAAWRAREGATAEAVLDDLGAAAGAVEAALRAGDAPGLGQALDEAQRGLVRIGVSDAGLDRLVAVARGAGALGAKLTGAGRGGCVMALAADPEGARAIAAAWLAAGAVAVYRAVEGV